MIRWVMGSAASALAVLGIGLVRPFTACGRTDVACTDGVDVGTPVVSAPSSGSSAGVTWTSDRAHLVVSNGILALRFDEKTGFLVGLTNKATGTELLPAGTHASLAAMVNVTTSNVWKAVDVPWTTSALLRSIAVRTVATGVTVDLTFAIQCSGVTAVQHATLEGASPVSSWTTDVSVAPNANAVALAIRSPRVAGIGLPQAETLAWPWHEGALFQNPGDDLQTLEYPVPASMQWASLYDATEGIYLGAVDSAPTFMKELYYGRDPIDQAAGRELSMAFWPYVTPGRTWTTPVVEIGVSDSTGWYWGADRYRAWLLTAGMYKKQHAPFVQTLPGWHKGYEWITDAKTPEYSYCDLPELQMPETFYEQYGLSTLDVYGWSYLGLDHNYPDYDWLGGPDAGPDAAPCLQAPALANAINTLHARTPANHVIFYLNARSADARGNWYAAHRADVSAKQPDGSPYAPDGYEQASDGGFENWLDLVCPAAPAWIDQLASRAAALRALDTPIGADGIYWDQVAELPAHHCYDPRHGHGNPRSAGVQGIASLLTKLQSDFEAQVGATGFIFSGEGVSDYFATYMDVASPPPPRPLGYVPLHCDKTGTGVDLSCGATYAPQIARYTLPLRILGLQTQASTDATAPADGDAQPGAYAWAFVLNEPIRSQQYTSNEPTPNPSALPRYPHIDSLQPSIYFDGRFLDRRGLTVSGMDAVSVFDSNPPVLGSVIVGSAGDRVGVQLWNNGSSIRTLSVSVDLGALTLAGRTVSSVNDVEGVLPPFAFTTAGNVVSFVVPVGANDVRAIVVMLH